MRATNYRKICVAAGMVVALVAPGVPLIGNLSCALGRLSQLVEFGLRGLEVGGVIAKSAALEGRAPDARQVMEWRVAMMPACCAAPFTSQWAWPRPKGGRPLS